MGLLVSDNVPPPCYDSIKGKGKHMTRVRLLYTNDPYTKLAPGDTGTVIAQHVDPWGTVCFDVRWDDGSCLSLLQNEDRWEFISQ